MAAEWPASVTTTGREFSVGDRVRVVSPAARGWPAAAVTAGFSVWVRLLASGASGGLYEWLPSAATLVGREGVVQPGDARAGVFEVALDGGGPAAWLLAAFLEPTPGPCSCPTRDLMARGCTCGAFARERAGGRP